MKIHFLRSEKWSDWRLRAICALFLFGYLIENAVLASVNDQTNEQPRDFNEDFVQKRDVYKFDKKQLEKYKNKVKDMFYFAYDNYINNAYPYDELKPISCKGHDTWGSYSLTLIDSLDMLIILGNRTEYERVLELLTTNLNFDKDINVSVFETNIRIIGGLLSAHLLSYRLYLKDDETHFDVSKHLDPKWPCDGPLLRLAVLVANKILPAFDTATGMPYGTVNLRRGVPRGETTETCVAGVGTFVVEFATLSRLTGDPIYENAALKAMDALWSRRSTIDLVGNHINIDTGKWTAQDATIGSGVDSYFEYLVKGGILLNRPDLINQFHTYERAIKKYLSHDDWFLWSNMNKGHKTLPLFASLDAFYPGMLTLIGNLEQAIKTAKKYHEIWRQYGSLPEFFNINTQTVHGNREAYPLRPELIESVMYILRATNNDASFLEMALDYLVSIEKISRVSCGYATVKDVRDHRLEDRMESFFLAETLKYLYLIFDSENFLHNDPSKNAFKIIRNQEGECLIGTGYYIFNTEAHPIDGACLECCRVQHQRKMSRENADLDLNSYLDVKKLLNRYVQLSMKDEIAETASQLYTENIYAYKTFEEELKEFKQELRLEEARAEYKEKEFCSNASSMDDSQAKSFQLADEQIMQQARSFGHHYSFRCSQNSTFKLRISNFYTSDYFP